MKRSPSFPRVVLCSVVAQSVGEEASFFKNCIKKKKSFGRGHKNFHLSLSSPRNRSAFAFEEDQHSRNARLAAAQ